MNVVENLVCLIRCVFNVLCVYGVCMIWGDCRRFCKILVCGVMMDVLLFVWYCVLCWVWCVMCDDVLGVVVRDIVWGDVECGWRLEWFWYYVWCLCDLWEMFMIVVLVLLKVMMLRMMCICDLCCYWCWYWIFVCLLCGNGVMWWADRAMDRSRFREARRLFYCLWFFDCVVCLWLEFLLKGYFCVWICLSVFWNLRVMRERRRRFESSAI